MGLGELSSSWRQTYRSSLPSGYLQPDQNYTTASHHNISIRSVPSACGSQINRRISASPPVPQRRTVSFPRICSSLPSTQPTVRAWSPASQYKNTAMSPRGRHERKKASQPQTPLPSISETDVLPPQQIANPEYAHVFHQHTLRPVSRLNKPFVPPEMLKDLKITTIPLDFDSGESPNIQIPALIQLSDRKVFHAEL